MDDVNIFLLICGEGNRIGPRLGPESSRQTLVKHQYGQDPAGFVSSVAECFRNCFSGTHLQPRVSPSKTLRVKLLMAEIPFPTTWDGAKTL